MKRNRFFTIALMVTMAFTMQAQEQAETITVLKESSKFWAPYSNPGVDAETGLTTVKWRNTENKHVKGRDDQWAPSVITVSKTIGDNLSSYDVWNNGKRDDMTLLSWVLTEEQGETVLHCYMKMPAEVVTNFWLASEETAIVDSETGVQYRARRSNPDCWKQYFKFRAAKDSIIDFRIYFPPLPKTTCEIYIYGVPNWHLNGYNTITLNRPGTYTAKMLPYDEPPQFHHPRLIREAKNYDKNNSGSWAEFTDAHLIKPLKHNAMALWRTPDATYIAVAREQNWTREYFGEGPDDILIDSNGKQYKLKDVQDYPNGQIAWVRGNTGDWIAFVKVYEPLDPKVKTINYIVPEGEPFKAWGANWNGEVITDLNVEELRQNQKLFEYYPRVVVE